MKDFVKYRHLNITVTIVDHGRGFIERLPNNRGVYIQLREPKNKYEISGADFSFSIETDVYIQSVEHIIDLMIHKLNETKV